MDVQVYEIIFDLFIVTCLRISMILDVCKSDRPVKYARFQALIKMQAWTLRLDLSWICGLLEYFVSRCSTYGMIFINRALTKCNNLTCPIPKRHQERKTSCKSSLCLIHMWILVNRSIIESIYLGKILKTSGWLNTFDEYTNKTDTILNNALDYLSTHPNMTFTWSEISFFEHWWSNLDNVNRTKFKKLLSWFIYYKFAEFENTRNSLQNTW